MTVTAMPRKKSTTVRSIQSLSFLGVRAGFAALEWTAPGIGARWAERIWFTVPPHSGRAPAHPEPDRRFEVQVSGARVVARSWGEGRPVFLVHGWGGRGSDLGALVAPLVAAGYRVVAFDGLSHGESDPGPSGPSQATFLEFSDVLTAIAAAEGQPYAVVAHSGGAMGSAFALLGGLTVERMVFIAPMTEIIGYSRGFADRLGFGERIRARMLRRFEARLSLPMSTFDLAGLRAIERRTTPPPLFVVHDRDDAETRLPFSEELVRAWPGARLVTTTGLGHRRILRAPEVVGRVVDFVDAATVEPAATLREPAAS
jgi:pimeloyl-ACP methyl ester carboxylesterase